MDKETLIKIAEELHQGAFDANSYYLILQQYFNGSPKEQLACLNRAVEYVQLTEELETRFMAAVKRMKQAFNLCSSSDAISDKEKDYLHFYCAVRSILFKLTKGDAPDISQMNARVRELLEGAIQSDGIRQIFKLTSFCCWTSLIIRLLLLMMFIRKFWNKPRTSRDIWTNEKLVIV